MDKKVIGIKGISIDGKYQYIVEEANSFFFNNKKDVATQYISCDIYEAEGKIKKFLRDEGWNIEKLEFKRFKI